MSERLDHALANRGLARSRTAAARLVADGQVRVNGAIVTKASRQVVEQDALEVVAANAAYVSRGADKLLAALELWDLPVARTIAVDLGASTGGFTQVLLEHGAREVVAIDVGHEQLASLIASDVRVTNLEGVNVRYLTEASLDGLLRKHRDGRDPIRSSDVTIVVGDLSFISLRHILPAMRETFPNLQHAVLLVKPQFEVGRTQVKGGLVVDRGVAADAVLDVIRDARELGLEPVGFANSPITGTHGNREYLLHLAANKNAAPVAEAVTSPHPTEWKDTVRDDRIRELVTGGPA